MINKEKMTKINGSTKQQNMTNTSNNDYEEFDEEDYNSEQLTSMASITASMITPITTSLTATLTPSMTPLMTPLTATTSMTPLMSPLMTPLNAISTTNTTTSSSGFPSPIILSTNKVKKSHNSGHNNKIVHNMVSQEEMHTLLAKLKELVPNMPRNKKLSKLEIIQYVIDYIFDLQVALESHPSTHPSQHSTNITQITSKSSHNSSSISPQSSRQPLGLLSPASVNYTASQLMPEVFDKVLSE